MNRRLNKRNLITAIIIGEIMILAFRLLGLQNIEDTKILLTFFPVVMVALAIIVWFQINITDKIKEDALKLDKK